jgi:hypothetical protein
MKKVLNAVKVALLIATLTITGMSIFPQVAKAWEIDIYCDGSNNLCATVETSDVIIDFYLGNAVAVVIYL